MIKPLPGYVLIEPIDEEDKTSTGFLLPEKSKEKPAKGKVIDIGGYMKTTHDWLVLWDSVKIGNIVVFHKWSGQDVKDGQIELKLVKFGDLMGVYE